MTRNNRKLSPARKPSLSPNRGRGPNVTVTKKKDPFKFHKWGETLDAIEDGPAGESSELFKCNLGENHDIPLNPTITHVPNLKADATGNTETGGLLVDMHTAVIAPGTVAAKFQYGEGSKGEHLVQVIIPSSQENCIKQEPLVEEACEQSLWKDENRAKARKKALQAMKDADKVNHTNNYAFEMPTVTSSTTGETLKPSRKYFHEKEGEPEGTTRLRVSRKVVPGDITKEGQYVKLNGYENENEGKVPLTLVHFNFMLAFEDTLERINSDDEDSDSDSDSDEDLSDFRKSNAPPAEA